MESESTDGRTPDFSCRAETFDGTWERGGRSLNSAALAGLLGVGVIYFYGQSLIVSIVILVTAGGDLSAGQTDGFFQHLSRYADLTKNPIRVCLILTQFSLMLLPTWWLIRRWHTTDVRVYARLRPCCPAQVTLAACAIILLFPTNILVSEFIVSKLNMPEELVKINEILFTASNAREFVFIVLAIAVTPAVCEEILFRGYAQRTFERTIGWKSILLVGLLFGLYHMQPLGLLTLSGLGLVFGYFYYASKSIIPGMVAHFTNNFLVVLWLYLTKVHGLISFHGASALLPAVALIALPFAVLAVYLFQRVSSQRLDYVPVLSGNV